MQAAEDRQRSDSADWLSAPEVLSAVEDGAYPM
jgi:hypothetical protein